MDFFEAPPDEEPPVEPPTPPPWFQPPADVLAGLVPDRRVIATAPGVTVLLSHIDAYATGCHVRLQVVALRSGTADEDAWWELEGVLFGHRGRHRRRSGALPDDVPRFGVQFADGTKATTTAFPRAPHDDEPEGPVLVPHGGGGGGGGGQIVLDHHLWLWPLPPPEPFDLVVAWPAVGIELTRIEVDGAAIHAAAADVVPLVAGA